ncbi:MAG: hypothetical protein SO147_05480, partial [Clostridia bacterium]|nr:hypothetical protein [Clostridia bacterium]
MFDISVPIINITAEEMGLEHYLKMLKRLQAKRVFLSIDKGFLSEERKAKELAALEKNCRYFHEHGLEVGAWLWTFWVDEKNDFTHMKGATGREHPTEVCPSDEAYRSHMGNYIADVADCGVDLIMFDDDYRYHFYGIGMGCLCKNHVDYMEEMLGEPLVSEQLPELMIKNGKNRYRSAFLAANRHYFELFAKEMREAVNRVNPAVRLGLCACMSVWDVDGIDSVTITKLLAGDTEPFLRLIGAPYWAVNQSWGNRLQNIIELERMQLSWCGDGIEVFSEGDAWPRPRTNCPANYLEIFDTALRASGGFDGILKYAVDYTSTPSYEDGYIQRHEKNTGLYKEIAAYFEGKTACGIRVYERMAKFEDMVFSTLPQENYCIENVFFSPAAKLLADNSIPTVYEGRGICGIAFAENVSLVSFEAMKEGLILDLRAAEILSARGIDTGLVARGERVTIAREDFDGFGERYRRVGKAYEITVKENAVVLSHLVQLNDKGEVSRKTPGSYYYQNGDGQQFLVLSCAAYETLSSLENEYRGYVYTRLIKEAVTRFGGKLPAFSYGNPDLYLLAKKDDRSM